MAHQTRAAADLVVAVFFPFVDDILDFETPLVAADEPLELFGDTAAADAPLELLGDTFGLAPEAVPFFPFNAAFILETPTFDVVFCYLTTAPCNL